MKSVDHVIKLIPNVEDRILYQKPNEKNRSIRCHTICIVYRYVYVCVYIFTYSSRFFFTVSYPTYIYIYIILNELFFFFVLNEITARNM